MSYNPRQSYTVEAVPLNKPEGHYGWAIRLHGKLLERSDRFYRTEEQALTAGSDALDRQASAPVDKR